MSCFFATMFWLLIRMVPAVLVVGSVASRLRQWPHV